MKKTIKGFAIVWKHNGEVLESYYAFLYSIFPSKKLAIKELKFHKWPNYSRDLKIIPCTITYTLPKPSKKK